MDTTMQDITREAERLAQDLPEYDLEAAYAQAFADAVAAKRGQA
jgi:hypothetical protein